MTDQEKIDYIMDFFEFEKVEKTMKALDWKWASKDGDETPCLFEIKQFARKLIAEAVEKKARFLSCGGFTARFEDDNLSLSFEVDEATTETF